MDGWGGSGAPVEAQPEILPPDGSPRYGDRGYPRNGDPPVRSRPRWSYAPSTYVLVGINCAVFLAMIAGHVSPVSPTAAQLLHWGANYGLFVLMGQWWRLLTATFVHVGVLHLATNMWCLWNLGLLGEPLLGPVGMLAVYVLSGVAGNLLSTGVHPNVVGAGASGAVFGLAGVLIMLLKSPLLPVSRVEVKRLRQSVIYFAVLNFAIGASTWLFRTGLQIDNMAHLGGFVCGLALGVPLVPRIGAPRVQFIRRQRLAFYGMAALLLLFAFAVLSYWQ